VTEQSRHSCYDGPMSQPWSPIEVERKMAALIEDLDEAVLELKNITLHAASCKHSYELASARAFVTHRSVGAAQQEASQKALIDCADEHLDHLMAEGVAKSAYKRIDVLKAQADLMRSLLVSSRNVG